jgi:hypothetical protein
MEFTSEEQRELYHGIRSTNYEKVNDILDNYDIDSDNINYFFIESVQIGLFSVFDLFYHHPLVDLTHQQNKAIRLACEFGHTDIVRVLLNEEEVKPEVVSNAALRYSYDGEHYDIVELLLLNTNVLKELKNDEKLHKEIQKYILKCNVKNF